jgi:hypothetical protein
MTTTDKLLAVLSQLPSSIQWSDTSHTVYRVAIEGISDEDIKEGAKRILTRAKFRPTPSEVLISISTAKYGDYLPHVVINDIAEAIRLGTPFYKLHPTLQHVVAKTGGLKAWRVEPPIKGQQLQEVLNDVLLTMIQEHINEQRAD